MTTRNTRLAFLTAITLLLVAAVATQPAVAHPPDKIFDRVFSFSYRLPVGAGQELFVTEHFTLASVFRRPKRAVVFLTGPEFRGNFWSIPVEGYNGPEMAARRGFFAYTFDYIGVGESTVPEDGSGVNYLTQVEPVRKLIDLIRFWRRVDTVDLTGEGYGAEVASELADEPERVRSVTLSVVTYENYDPAILPFFSPQLEAFLRSSPNGYWEPDFLDQTLAFSPIQEVKDYVYATQPGVYPTGPILQFWDFDAPIIDAPAAEVPGLVIIGALDPFPAAGDPQALADEWGGGADLVLIPGSFHVPRIEAPDIAAQYFAAFFDFIDP